MSGVLTTPVEGTPPVEPDRPTDGLETAPEPAAESTPEPDPTPDVAPEPEPTPESAVTAETFDWDGWDGSLDALPEEARGWADRAAARRLAQEQADITAAMEKAEARAEMYTRLMDENADPRVAELQAERDALTEEKAQLDANLKELEAKAETSASEAEAIREAWRVEKVAEFRAKNDWMFDGGEVEKLASELVSEGWDAQQLPEVLRLAPAERAKARERFKKNPKAGDEIILLVKATAQKAPSIAAELVGGANEATVTTPATQPVDISKMSRSDQIRLVVERKMTEAKTRRRRST